MTLLVAFIAAHSADKRNKLVHAKVFYLYSVNQTTAYVHPQAAA
jgi:hypothetical protein